MAIAIDLPQPAVTQAEALWVVFQNQPESVQADFLMLLKADEERRKSANLRHHPNVKYSDAELDELLKDCPMVCEDEISEMTDEDFHTIARNMSHKPIRGIEKWL